MGSKMNYVNNNLTSLTSFILKIDVYVCLGSPSGYLKVVNLSSCFNIVGFFALAALVATLKLEAQNNWNLSMPQLQKKAIFFSL